MGVPWLERPPIKKSEERYTDAIKELDNVFLSFKNEKTKLENENKGLTEMLSTQGDVIEKLNYLKDEHAEFLASITPVKVYYHRKRGNTTVKFLDGTSVTVKRAKGDRNCLETAIVYALYKKIYPRKLLENLVANVEKTGGRKCKKR